MRKSLPIRLAPVRSTLALAPKRRAYVALLLTLLLASSLSILRSQYQHPTPVQIADGGTTKPGGG